MGKGIYQGFIKIAFAIACSIAVTAGILLGQGATGAISGTVTDPTGAVIPGAAVTITNSATGVNYNVTTNSAGFYLVSALQPGNYSIQVGAKGFSTFIDKGEELVVGQNLAVNATLKVGQSSTSVTVEAAAPVVNTTQGRLSHLVTGQQIQEIPLNGRDVYELMYLVPGAVVSMQVDFEGTEGANINGARGNFNGFLFDDTVNKGLSGGANAHPAPDFLSEYQVQTNDFSAEYSSSAGSITDVSTKSGTNHWHGDAFEFFRNDKLNARNFFDGATRAHFRLNEYGATLGGPIKKDKIFIFGGWEGEEFRTASPFTAFTETDAFHQAVISSFPNSVAALFYKNFPGPKPTSSLESGGTVVDSNAINEYGAPSTIWNGTPYDPALTNGCKDPANQNACAAAYGTDAMGNPAGFLTNSTTGINDYFLNYLDPCYLSSFVGVGTPAVGSLNWGNPQTVANKMATLLGVTSAENARIQSNINSVCPGMFTAPAVQTGAFPSAALMEGSVNVGGLTQDAGNFYTGNQYTVKGDYQGDKNRMFGRYYFYENKNANSAPSTGIRGFTTPATASFPGAAFSWVRTISPTLVNTVDLGWTRNQGSFIPATSQFGVPYVTFDTGEPQFGAYNGFPQFFNEDVFDLKDMVQYVKGNHTLKMGFEGRANYENSEFNVGRPSYSFFDPFYFANDLPYFEAAGVNPDLINDQGQAVASPSSHIDTNLRAWRNKEYGAFIQDDWKATSHLTLNLGLRWDFFSPHTEKYNHATNLILGPGSSFDQRLASINCEVFLGTTCLGPTGDTQSPNGGFTREHSLFPDRWTNFAPRFGFAWDPFGTGKNSIRGGAAISYEDTFYNALSNSRWNLPFYSFNEASPIFGIAALPVYGPTNPDGTPDTAVAPTYSGSPTQPGALGNGPAGLGFAGNISGWFPGSPNKAVLTGIPSPNYKLPYYEQFFLGVQHELSPSTVVEIDGVSTLGRRLFWAENPNRVVNGKARNGGAGITNPCTGATVKTFLVNPCFGTMRTWETSVNSSYYSLQASFRRKFSRGLAYTSSYTWSHSLDYRSTWHALTGSGSATDANSGGEAGYSLDPNRLYLEKGNSLYDARHRWVSSVIWDLPWKKSEQGIVGKFAGGWETTWNISIQSGFPFTVSKNISGGQPFNGTGLRVQRPDTPSFGNHFSWSSKDWERGSGATNLMHNFQSAFPAPPAGTDGNLGRNTFRGPGLTETDFGLFKKIPLGSNEARYLQVRAEFYNLFNHTNLNPPVANSSSGKFGYATSALDPREIQFALKLYF